MLEESTRKPRESRVVFSVCSRGRYTRNPSLDIYLLSVSCSDSARQKSKMLRSEIDNYLD